MKRIILLALLFVPVISFSQTFRLVKINIDSHESLVELNKLGINLEDAARTKDNSVEVFMSESEFERLNMLPYTYEILIEDWMAYYQSLPKLSESEKLAALSESKELYNVEGFGYGSMGGYYTFQEVVNHLDSMYNRYPNLITQKYSIGTSQLGRTIWAAKISDNPNVNENEPQTLFDGLIHAREPQSMATVMYFMYYLLENYGINPEVTYLVNNREFYFVPCLNPDGYEHNRSTAPNGGGSWRKNRRNNSNSDGVDLNRNFGYKWGYDNNGSSSTPSSVTYRGPSAFSEPEAQAIRNLAIEKRFRTYINYHSYNNSIIYPWGYINTLTPDSLEFIEFASYMSRFNGYDYGTSYQTLGYVSNGTARDYMYGEQVEKNKIYSYVFEIGGSSDGFWPPQARIFPLAQANLRPNLFQAWMAGEYVGLNNYSFNQPYISPGENPSISFSLKNKGLETAYNVSAVLSTSDPYITVLPNLVVVDSVPARTVVNSVTPVSFSVAPNTPVGRQVTMLLTIQNSNVIFSVDTIRFSVGVPIYVFKDTTNIPTTLWTITASPSTPAWEATTASFYSAPNSYTDSRTGVYANNATVSLISKDNINLAGLNAPKLTFWTKYDMEASWDCGVVMISTNNGSTWTALQGAYTVPASGQGKQVPAGMPVYQSLQSNWVKEEISLAQYIGMNVKIKFELRTDVSQQKDGWYIDDIGIYELGIVPVELISFSATVSNDNVILDWTTASELNNKGFNIDRSADGITWENLSFIAGAGTYNSTRSYNFTDKSPYSGESYYRLTQLDYDGTSKSYQPVKVNFEKIYNFYLSQSYPNPVSKTAKIKFGVPSSGKKNIAQSTSLVIYDILGKEISSQVNEQKLPGEYEAQFDVSALPSGVYIYKLSCGEYSASRKLIITR
ncbi:MAG: immune inhibitor A [Ignavibacteriaceae bacterium]|nr:immune inhibitor A [Ignavibacteriaceae bacterium]